MLSDIYVKSLLRVVEILLETSVVDNKGKLGTNSPLILWGLFRILKTYYVLMQKQNKLMSDYQTRKSL